MCNTTQVTPFKVVAKNEERGQPEASYVRMVKVFLPHNTEVELQKGRRVLVHNFVLDITLGVLNKISEPNNKLLTGFLTHCS